MHGAPRMRRDVALVRDENDGVPALVQIFKQRHNFFARFRIQIAGRFIRQNDGRLIHEGAGDRYALALTARQFVWFMIHPIAQTNFVQDMGSHFLARVWIDPGVNQRQLDIA